MEKSLTFLAILITGILMSLDGSSANFTGTVKPNGATSPNLAAGCAAANGFTDMDLNNVRARIHTGGDMWWDLIGTPKYEIPKGSGKHSLFAGSLWMGGQDVNGQLKVAAQRFREFGNDFWPGPLNVNTSEIDAATCSEYDRHFVITRQEVDMFNSWYLASQDNPTQAAIDFPGYQIPASILNWPAHGNVAKNEDFYLAPFYDRNGDGIYNPLEGDYPKYDLTGNLVDCRTTRQVKLYGDRTLWWVFNDKGNVHTETGAASIGMEIRAQSFAFATNDEINNMTFCNYELINRSSFTLTNTYFGQWADPDLGFSDDDYVGCDVKRGLGYCYNGVEVDGTGGPGHYGVNPPAVGIDFFEGPYQDNDGLDNAYGIGINEALNGIGYGDGIVDNERFGMRRFLYHNRNPFGIEANQDPRTGSDYYNYLRGIWKDGTKMLYGGNGHSSGGGDPAQLADFMFPGNSDPDGWGTGGNTNVLPWTEETAGIVAGDRRFAQSAGPFTLLPGAVNDITVGVVWARATSGGPFASVEKLRQVDDKAQALFDNCFRLLNGPDAPELTIKEMDKELILLLSNKTGSNNFNENYAENDFRIPKYGASVTTTYVYDSIMGGYNQVITYDTITYDNQYRFQGYLIYQAKDATVSPDEIGNPDRARLVAQCDLKDSIVQLVNYKFDETLNSSVPEDVVINGENMGVVHSFRMLEDKFAQGDKRLVNHKQYYYMAISYAHNNYKKFDMNDPLLLDGQKKPYVLSRKSVAGAIKLTKGIPHNPSPGMGGTILNSTYGDAPYITRIEGQGNGGMVLDFTSETEAKIMSGAPWRALAPVYKKGRGPINVKVVDPLSVIPADFSVRFIVNGNGKTAIDTAYWILKNLETGDSIQSSKTIRVGNEQIIPSLGISITIEQAINPGVAPESGNGYIESSIEFADASKRWLTGVADQDGNTPFNWIRSGTFSDPDTSTFNDFPQKDNKQVYEKVIGGTFSPYGLTSYTAHGPSLNLPSTNLAKLDTVKSVDIVITADQSKWTRCPVIENQINPLLAEGGAKKNFLRQSPSVGKDGKEDGTGTGMSWFPGYAICLETGERLNMAFSEDSWLAGENGRDMIWNPSANAVGPSHLPPFGEDIRFGGKHYIYVFNNERIGDTNPASLKNKMPAYDEGAFMHENLTSGSTAEVRNAWRGCMWVGLPMLQIEQTFMACDVRIRLRVNRRYQIYKTESSQNNNNPLYSFSTRGMEAIKDDAKAAEDALALINVVPNPYYAYSGYETDQLDNRIKIINLPEVCQIAIYTVNGTLVRRFSKADPLTSLDWDLKNHAGIPIAGGVYLIHVNVEGVGEKVLKWFGILRPIDLDTF